jgi:hypothetical protein
VAEESLDGVGCLGRHIRFVEELIMATIGLTRSSRRGKMKSSALTSNAFGAGTMSSCPSCLHSLQLHPC